MPLFPGINVLMFFAFFFNKNHLNRLRILNRCTGPGNSMTGWNWLFLSFFIYAESEQGKLNLIFYTILLQVGACNHHDVNVGSVRDSWSLCISNIEEDHIQYFQIKAVMKMCVRILTVCFPVRPWRQDWFYMWWFWCSGCWNGRMVVPAICICRTFVN